MKFNELLTPFPEIASYKIFLGFDAFIDRIVRVVEKRVSSKDYQIEASVLNLAERLSQAAGKSCNVELVTKFIKSGGNSFIMANAMGALQQKIYYAGTIGSDRELFKLTAAERVWDVGPSPESIAVEFDDAKVILGLHEKLFTLQSDNLLKHQTAQQWFDLLIDCDLCCFLNWTMHYSLQEMMDLIYTQFLKEHKGRKNQLFIDLADPAKRSSESIVEFIDYLRRVGQSGVKVILSLNYSEFQQVYQAYCLENLGRDEKQSTLKLFEILQGIDTLAIHTMDSAFGVDRKHLEFKLVTFPRNPKPLITTGGGDHFNAGLATGLVNQFSLQQSMALGAATALFYVSTAQSPSRDQIRKEVNNYNLDF